MFLDAPNTFIESHVCLSGEPFTRRIAPGQCQFQGTGGAAGHMTSRCRPTRPIRRRAVRRSTRSVLCAGACEVLVPRTRPHAPRRRQRLCRVGIRDSVLRKHLLPVGPDPEPPGEGTADVAKTGAFVAGDVVFTVTVSNPTTFVASDVVVWDQLPPTLAWTLPPECVLGPADSIARWPSATWRGVPRWTSSSRPRRRPASAGRSATTPRRHRTGSCVRRCRSRAWTFPARPIRSLTRS